jgi:hypothetical protein
MSKIFLFSESASDQVVGRAVCGLPLNTPVFSSLPPRLYPDDFEIITIEIRFLIIIIIGIQDKPV